MKSRICSRIFSLIIAIIMCFSLVGINTDFSYAATKKPAKVKTPTVSINDKKVKVTWKKVKNVKIKGKTYKVKYQLRVTGTIKMNNKTFNYNNSFKTAKNSYTITSNKGNKFKFKVRSYYKKGSKTIYGTYSKWTKYRVIPGETSTGSSGENDDIENGVEIDNTGEPGVTYTENYNTVVNNSKVVPGGGYNVNNNTNIFTFFVKDTANEYIIRAIENTPSKVRVFFGNDKTYAINSYKVEKSEFGVHCKVVASPYTSGVKVNIFNKKTGAIVYSNGYDITEYMFSGITDSQFMKAEDAENPFDAKYNDLINTIYNNSGISAGDSSKVKLQKILAFIGDKVYNNNQNYGVRHDICSYYNIKMPAIDCVGVSNDYAWMYYQLTGIRGGSCYTFKDGPAVDIIKKIDPNATIKQQGEYGSHMSVWAYFTDGTNQLCDLTNPCQNNDYWTAKDPNLPLEDAIWGWNCGPRNYEALYNYTPWRNWIKQIIPNWSEWFNFN